MSPAYLIHAKLAQFLMGAETVTGLRKSLAEHTWGVCAWGNSQDCDLAGSVDLALSEFEAGHLTEEELRKELGELCGLVLIESPTVTSAASIVAVDAPAWSPWARIQSAGESSLQVVHPV